MKILAISDRPPKQSIRSILEQSPIDLICTLGDLDQVMLQELELVTHLPKIGVYGNHDSGMYFEPLGIQNMHLKSFEYGGITFGGFEGCVRYKNDPYVKMYTQEEAIELLKDFPRVDVMFAHCPPYGVNDEPNEIAHQGFHALRTYVETKKPQYLFHGHTYPKAESMVTRLVDTDIVYVYGEKIIDIG